MYHIFFQPTDAVNVLKKHSNKAFVAMLFVSSLLVSLGVTILMQAMSGKMKIPAPMLSTGALNTLQLFIVLTAAVFAGSFLKAGLLHLIMKIFTDKGVFMDALKVIAITTFLPGIYLLLVIIISTIPFVGPGLAMLALLLGLITTVALGLRLIATVYKTDLMTGVIALGVMCVAGMIVLHVAFFSAVGSGMLGSSKFSNLKADADGRWGGPMMGQWKY